MSFGREQKRLNEQLVFNPPPGYYDSHQAQARHAPSFGHSQRFQRHHDQVGPGPGAYHNNQKEVVRKRLIEQSQRRQMKSNEANSSNNIKISSIPSIPKKSATRVYEQLAPGILILHEQQYENSSLGPGSYNVTDKLLHRKPIAHKIPPERKPKVIEEENTEVNIPTVAEQIRNQRRMMYKQNLVKSSTVNKSEINPSDLCLQVIILREKLLRSDENPPPGYYHNDYHSDFKIEDKKAENQYLGGRQKRFQANPRKSNEELGPGKYTIEEETNDKGGFIPKEPRKLHPESQDKPGPGAYITVKPKPKAEIKGNYPPIFGSGMSRFPSAPKKIESESTPGPGAYRVDKKKSKKQKYIKIRKELIEPSKQQHPMDQVIGIQNDFSQISNAGSVRERRLYQFQKNSSNFASKVQRFEGDRSFQDKVGPGNYNPSVSGFDSRSFNRKPEGYVGNRMARFDQTEVRPKIGPGTYNPGYQTVKQKKVKNLVF